MNISTAIVAACAAAFALAQAPPARAADPAAAAPPALAASPAPVTPAPAWLDLQARRDVGCIGYRGQASGIARHGKCIPRQKKT